MPQVRGDLIHRNKNKCSVLQISMGNMKRRAVNNLLVIKQNIKIQRPWSPVNNAFPVCLLLQLMQAPFS